MFSILEASNYELRLWILEVLLMIKLKPEFCAQKQFYMPILFLSLLEPREANFTHADSTEAWEI